MIKTKLWYSEIFGWCINFMIPASKKLSPELHSRLDYGWFTVKIENDHD